MGLRLTYRGRITVTYVDFERFGAQGGWSRGVADAGRGRRDAEPPQRATRDAVRRATLPDIWRWGSGKPPLQWHETHQLNGRVILSTRGGDVRRYPRRATAATRKSGRGAQVIMSGALGFTGGSSAITTGTNPCAGIGQRKRLDGAHACSARQWRTFSSGDQTSNALRDRLWCLVERTPNLDWLLLTKRPELARRLTPWRAAWPSNVWLGTTVENQHFADQRIDEYIHLFLVVTNTASTWTSSPGRSERATRQTGLSDGSSIAGRWATPRFTTMPFAIVIPARRSDCETLGNGIPHSVCMRAT